MDWIAEGEKYALVGLSVKLDDDVKSGPVSATQWVVTSSQFQVPAHWKDWLGSIRAEEVEDANLLLLSKVKSAQPAILDAENKSLKHFVSLWYLGLLLVSPFSTAHKPVVLTGARIDGEVGVRQQGEFEVPVPSGFRQFPSVPLRELTVGARLAENIKTLEMTPPPGKCWRLFRLLHLYQETRANPDILERVHQYSRCIDGLILPSVGETKRQFKSRTELLIGPHHHDLMGEIYDVRSAVEHLHENRYLEGFDRALRLDLLKKEAIVEWIARSSLFRVVERPILWPYFANTDSLARFWSLPAPERRRIWGDPIDPLSALEGFDPKYIHDGLLGR